MNYVVSVASLSYGHCLGAGRRCQFGTSRVWRLLEESSGSWSSYCCQYAKPFRTSTLNLVVCCDKIYLSPQQGCLVILFTNFLALVIKAGVASKDSSGSAAYSVVLIVVNVMFFLSIWGNAWTTAKATFSRSHAQVREPHRAAPRVGHAVQQ